MANEPFSPSTSRMNRGSDDEEEDSTALGVDTGVEQGQEQQEDTRAPGSTTSRGSQRSNGTGSSKKKPRTDVDAFRLTSAYGIDSVAYYFKNQHSREALAYMNKVSDGVDEKFGLSQSVGLGYGDIEEFYNHTNKLEYMSKTLIDLGLFKYLDVYEPFVPDDDGIPFMEQAESYDVIKGNLLEDYRTLEAGAVGESEGVVYEYGDDKDVWATKSLLLSFMENSCEPELKQKVKTLMMGYQKKNQGGVLFFKLMMDTISATTYSEALLLLKVVRELQIKKYDGEDVPKIVGYLRGLHDRLSAADLVPPDWTKQVMRICSTSSNTQYNRNFINWDSDIEREVIRQGGKYDDHVQPDQIYELAIKLYNMYVNDPEKYWLPTKKKNTHNAVKSEEGRAESSKNETKNTGNSDDKAKGTKKQANEQSLKENGEGKTVPKYMKAPEPGEPWERMFRGKPEYWCPKCGRWRRHKAEEHRDQPVADDKTSLTKTRRGANTSALTGGSM